MFDGLNQKEQYGLVGAAVLLAAIGFGAGTMTSGGAAPTGNVAATGGDTDQIQQSVQSFMDQQLQRQQQQLEMVANRSENLTMDDLSMDATVTNVEQSKFGGLYKVTVSISGTVPQRLGSGTRNVNQEQTLYMDSSGRYLFQEPTDLEQPRQPTRRQPPTSPQQ